MDSGFIFRYRAFPRLAFNLWPGLLCLSLLFGLAAPIAAQQQALDLSEGDALALSFASAPVSAAVLVSNTGQSDNTTGSLGHDHAQAFTTGDNAGGYTLTGVEIEFASAAANSATSFSVGIWSSTGTGNNIRPDALLGALTCPSLTANANSFLYNCTTSGIDLESSTTYMYVFDSQSNGSTLGEVLQNTGSDAEDAGAASGWSIADNSLFRTWNETGAWNQFSDSKKIRVNGTAKTSTTPAITVTRGSNLPGNVFESSASTLEFVVTANPAPSSPLSATLGVTATHTAATPTPSGAGTVNVTVPTSGSVTHTVGIVDDSNVETDGTVTVTVNPGTGYTVGNPSSATVTVQDNDLPPATLALTPTQLQAGSLSGAKITLNPDNATFFGAGGGGVSDGQNPVTSYVNSADLVSGNVPDTAVRLSAAGLAFITLSGAPAGLTIASGRLLARQTGTRSTRGVNQYRPAEITLAYSGSAITADDPVTVTVGRNLLRYE